MKNNVKVWDYIVLGFLAIFYLLPTVMTIIYALAEKWYFGTDLFPSQLGFGWIQKMISDSYVQTAFINSYILAPLTALVTILISILPAYYLATRRDKVAIITETIVNLTMAFPAIVVGTAERYYSEINYANLVASNITFYNLSLTASNLLVIPLDSLRVYQHNKIQNLTSVRYLIIESPSEKVLNAFYVQANVKGGIGFYAKLEADRMYVPNGNVSVYFDDGVISELKGDLLFEGKFLVLARRPIFTAQRSVIRGVFGQSLLYPYLARDLIVIGNATFRFVRGDDSFLYFFVDASNSKIMFDPSLNIYSEWESVPLVLKYSYWIIVIICVFIAKRLQRLLKRRRP